MIIFEPITKLKPNISDVVGKTMINKDGVYCGKVVYLGENNWFDTDMRVIGYDNWMGFGSYLRDYASRELERCDPTFIKIQMTRFSPQNNIFTIELI